MSYKVNPIPDWDVVHDDDARSDVLVLGIVLESTKLPQGSVGLS